MLTMKGSDKQTFILDTINEDGTVASGNYEEAQPGSYIIHTYVA